MPSVRQPTLRNIAARKNKQKRTLAGPSGALPLALALHLIQQIGVARDAPYLTMISNSTRMFDLAALELMSAGMGS